jgi:thiamine monophosphate kinase
VPVQQGADRVARTVGREPGWFAASGGEDYELVTALPRAALATAGIELIEVGEIEDGAAGAIRFTGGGSDDPPHGYDHLREG